MKNIKLLLQLLVLSIAISIVVLRLILGNDSSNPTPSHLKFPQTTLAFQNDSFGKVREVFDGDTILLESGEVIRYQGIDTPEIAHLPKKEECFGEEAKKRNESLVLGKNVRLVKDKTNYDYYGRLLRYVYLDDVFINEQLVSEGMAFVVIYPPDEEKSESLKKAELLAKENKIGLWKKCDLSKRKKF